MIPEYLINLDIYWVEKHLWAISTYCHLLLYSPYISQSKNLKSVFHRLLGHDSGKSDLVSASEMRWHELWKEGITEDLPLAAVDIDFHAPIDRGFHHGA